MYTGQKITRLMYGDRVIRPKAPIEHIELTAVTTASNQTVKINKYFTNSFDVDRGDGSPIATLSSDTTHTYTTAGEYQIKLTLASGASRWTFGNAAKPLVPKSGTTASNIYISSMPSLDYFGNSATTPGDYFFQYFNNSGALTSLPENSFNTSNITTAGDVFFYLFNYEGALTSLPEGSFNTSNITTAGNSFFSDFNRDGALTSLPENSFDTSNITTVGNNFFASFNYQGGLTSLPENSFNTSNITTVGDSFFSNFNRGGALTSLPAGSFNLSQLTVAIRSYYLSSFNNSGKLTKQVGGIQIKNASNAIMVFHYWNGSSTVSETVYPGNIFNGYTVG